MAWGGYEIKGAYESRHWPSTPGTITSSSISKQTRRDSNHRTRTTYYPRVQYQYQVDGKHCTSDRIEFGGASGGTRSKAKKLVDRYSPGKKVKVYYNPRDPEYAVLKAGFTWGAIFILLAGIVFFGLGVICYRAYKRNKDDALTLSF